MSVSAFVDSVGSDFCGVHDVTVGADGVSTTGVAVLWILLLGQQERVWM